MIIGYQVFDFISGANWKDRPANEILSESTAIREFKETIDNGEFGWTIKAIIKGAIDDPIFEHPFIDTDDQYKSIVICTDHLTNADKELLHHLAKRDDENMVLERETGYFVKIYEDTGIYAKSPFSDNLMGIVISAHLAGYRMIEFDRDASVSSDLEVFE